MQNIFHSILLGILQGFTEFLPVSSSAHLILLPKIMGWQDFGLGFDIAIHVGSLIAIISYFLCDQKFKAELKKNNLFHLSLLIGIATIPVGSCGLIFNKYISANARSIPLIATTTVIFGILLGIAYYIFKQSINKPNKLLDLTKFSIKYALIIGIAQALAIIPGVSRSGITLTAALLLGFNLLTASRISFMMSIPVILAAGAKQGLDLFTVKSLYLNPTIITAGFISSMLSSMLFVSLFFKYVAKIGMWPFVIYRILLGICLISC